MLQIQGKIVATATLEDIRGSIEELCEKEINKAIDELKAKYGEEYTGKLDNFSFECPAIAGEIKATIDMSDVEKENGGNVTYTFTADGKTYTGVEKIKGYVDSQLEAIKAEINKEIDKLLNDVKVELDFAKSEVKVWECRNCGHIVVGTNAPEICPTCAHPQSYFEIYADNY